MKLRTLIFGIYASVMFFAVSVNAATIYYDDETLFLSAISSPSLESLEALTATNTQSNADVCSWSSDCYPRP